MDNRAQTDADMAFALELQRREMEGLENGNQSRSQPRSQVPNLTMAMPARSDLVHNRSNHLIDDNPNVKPSLLTRMTSYFYLPRGANGNTQVPENSAFSIARSESGQVRSLGRTQSGNVFTFGRSNNGEVSGTDNAIARMLQAMEFEVAGEIDQAEDFNNKEYAGGMCLKQMCTLSTFILVVQITILAIQVSMDGQEDPAINPMYGPPATTLVKVCYSVVYVIV